MEYGSKMKLDSRALLRDQDYGTRRKYKRPIRDEDRRFSLCGSSPITFSRSISTSRSNSIQSEKLSTFTPPSSKPTKGSIFRKYSLEKTEEEETEFLLEDQFVSCNSKQGFMTVYQLDLPSSNIRNLLQNGLSSVIPREEGETCIPEETSDQASESEPGETSSLSQPSNHTKSNSISTDIQRRKDSTATIVQASKDQAKLFQTPTPMNIVVKDEERKNSESSNIYFMQKDPVGKKKNKNKKADGGFFGSGDSLHPSSKPTSEKLYYKHTTQGERRERETIRCVILDVGGERFIAQRRCLLKYPSTRLGKLMRAESIQMILELCDEFVPGDPPEYYFDKNPDNFDAILEMHRTGYLHVSGTGCALVLQKDLEYWLIDELLMEACCALKYYPQIEVCQNEKEGDIAAKKKEMELADEEDFGNGCFGKWRSWLWNTMEYPWTSQAARFMAFFSLSMVMISTFTFVISTIDELQENEQGEFDYPLIIKTIDIIDNFSIGFFTIEYIVRLCASPRKYKFVKGPMNMIDLFAIIPFYLSILLEGLEDFEIIGKAGKIIRLVKVMRILRIYKLVRHFAGLQSLFYTLQQAYKELGLLFLLVAVAILTFSSLVYFAEKNSTPDAAATLIYHPFLQGSNHTWTFVESFWWGLMTLTTVGYDLSPETLLGKIIGGFCALSGVFILTLPIPIVVNSFAQYYKNRMWRNEVSMRKRERMRQQALELRQMQKLFLLKTMASPGNIVVEQPDLTGNGKKDGGTRIHQPTSKLSRIL